ncbi:hypothetical protein Tco_0365565 [Tanacetum coccineum]
MSVFTIHCLQQLTTRSKSWGNAQCGMVKDNSSSNVHYGSSITSLKPSLANTQQRMHVDSEKAQGMKLFTLESLSEEAQTCHNHGLPRWQSVCSKSNPTDEI